MWYHNKTIEISYYMLKFGHNEGKKKVMYPIKLLQGFPSPPIHIQEGVVYHVNNNPSTLQGFYV